MISPALMSLYPSEELVANRVREAQDRLSTVEQRDQVVGVLARWTRNQCLIDGLFIAPNDLLALSREQRPAAALVHAGLEAMAERFDLLWDSGETRAPEAAWLYGEALAGLAFSDPAAVASAVTHVSLWGVAYTALMDTVLTRLHADTTTQTQLEKHVQGMIEATNADPSGGFVGGREESFRVCIEAAARTERESGDIADLWSEHSVLEGWDCDWLPLLEIVRRVDRDRYVTLLELFALPQSITAALQFLAIRGDVEEIKVLLSIAPVVMVAGQWNQHKVAPLLLSAALWHVQQLCHVARGEPTWAEEIEGECESAVNELLQTLLARTDGPALASRWLVHLARTFVIRSGWQNVRVPPSVLDSLYAEWIFVDQLAERLLAASVVVVNEYPVGTGKTEPFVQISGICSTSQEETAQVRTLWTRFQHLLTEDSTGTSSLVVSAPQINNWAYQMYGQLVALQPDAPGAWRQQWRAIYPLRHAARYVLASDHKEQGSSGRLLAAAGVWAVDWLTSMDHKEKAREMWSTVMRGAHESWLTEIFRSDFWSDVLVRLFARHPQLFREPDDEETYPEVLGRDLKLFVGIEPGFLKIMVTLTLNGVTQNIIRRALSSGGSDAGALARQVLAVSQLSAGRHGVDAALANRVAVILGEP